MFNFIIFLLTITLISGNQDFYSFLDSVDNEIEEIENGNDAFSDINNEEYELEEDDDQIPMQFHPVKI
ncbi:hypothetical protein ENU1_044460 [Entamoeba nuttalli P19]|uniref:Uncharacterized protein n=1 Tax=Entamoeba nuttalli (strain P19) TaxID=1076696 RepID=K2GGC9_ENTNP|nr:hypothetical protein ENU1_044460 [Entamoeba nuttalli P19]EKE41796.1 hypothetical protein ENU1_044460 [Entamoeba nuttalli P19]|eukprot:XP_008855872.1 hypothetical protein ENU1_044460 [Entamoeba nuttalli P19]